MLFGLLSSVIFGDRQVLQPPLGGSVAERLTNSLVCRWCGKGPLSFKFNFKASLYGGENEPKSNHVMEWCLHCGSFQVNPHPAFEVLKEYFIRRELIEKPGIDPDGNKVLPLQRANSRLPEYQAYVKAILPRLKDKGSILDIGAGTGLMLSLFPDKYKRIALEPNPAAASFARKRGLIVSEIFAEELESPPEPLILVIFNQSLDHFTRPDLILGKALNWLVPGGLVLISGLINPRSIAARITGPMFRLWHPFHQVYPPFEATLNKLVCHGFEILSVWKPYFKTPYGSVPALAKGAFQLAKAFMFKSKNTRPSPPWPGNTISYLALKRVVSIPASALDENADPFHLNPNNTRLPSPLSRSKSNPPKGFLF
jgi:SAM-dependent methyltransferase